MHSIEPYYQWRNLYVADEDERSPFYGREYSEFAFTDQIYDHLIHPQWDNFGSTTLFMKLLYADYDERFAVIELMGEWNDCLYNDIMTLKREIVDHLMDEGIQRFIIIGENILSFHSSDDCYYEEWREDVEDGWIALIGFREHVLDDMRQENLNHHLIMEENIIDLHWATYRPLQLYQKVEQLRQKALEQNVSVQKRMLE